MMSDQFEIRLKMFIIVELTKLGGQNFKLGLLLGKFLALKMKGHLKPLSESIIEQSILIQKSL